MSEVLYDTLKHYVTIEKQQNNYNYKKNYKSNYYNNEDKGSESQSEYVKVDLNSASQEELMNIKGVGKYSYGIVKYRNFLGGYSSVEQLKEVYNMRLESYEKIKDKFKINQKLLLKINLNKADFKDIVKHPYIDKNVAILIINYRDKANIMYNVEELLENEILDEELYYKIEPYLSTE
jgi:competence ComEA-like helix-hairpin-helix protein